MTQIIFDNCIWLARNLLVNPREEPHMISRAKYTMRSAMIVLTVALVHPCWGWTGKVVSIADGDTITVLHESRPERIRLYGIDCPERRQPFGNRARQVTGNALFGKVVEVHPFDMDQYGNTVGIVRIRGVVLNEELIRAGLAWVYVRYCHLGICRKWEGLMEEARSERRGLWADPKPIPPWEFRREKESY
jgi:micrococcal nuclease